MRSQLYTAEDVGYLSPDRRWARFAERTGFVRLPDGRYVRRNEEWKTEDGKTGTDGGNRDEPHAP